MQPPLVWKGRFLERECVSHELHRVWRYVTTLVLLGFFLIFFFKS